MPSNVNGDTRGETMHCHLEVVMPPTDDIEGQVAQIMAPFDENAKADEDNANGRYGFWDWYIVGGRFAGSKVEARIGRENIARFSADLAARGVTVSGLQFGKPALEPSSQIAMVDTLWLKAFPDSGLEHCPLFKRANDQYDSEDTLPGDICTLGDLPQGLTAERVIVAGPKWDGSGMAASFMISQDSWNGVTNVPAAWAGTVAAAIAEHTNRLSGAKDAYRAARIPEPDWLVVTVDYHS